jgi:hypothetical protein
MMKHALVIALLGLGIGLAGHAPATAGGRCFELPVVSNFVAFVELLSHEEFDRHCDGHFDDDSHYVHKYDEPKDLTAKGSGYTHPDHVERRLPPK